VTPVVSCAEDDSPHEGDFNVASSCSTLEANSAYTCFSMVPRAIDDTLSYGYAAVPDDGTGDVCGRCYELTFLGTGYYNDNDPGSREIQGKRMIVQAIDTGWDLNSRQFDLLIPGGGVGLFDACTYQWGVTDPSVLGAQYGGLLTTCSRDPANRDHDALKACVRDKCDTLFAGSARADLRAGCGWFIDWFAAADNPDLDYREIPCPVELAADSGVDRRALDDVEMCE